MAAVYRRALPPRPSLLVSEVGDVDGLHTAWSALYAELLALTTAADEGGFHEDELHERFCDVVARLRFMRESLIANYVSGPLAIKVYEASVDACSRCLPDSEPELLKALQGVVTLYSSEEGQESKSSPREQEMAAAWISFFSVSRSGSVHLRADHLRRHFGSQEVQFALRMVSAVARSDFHTYLKNVRMAPTPLLRRLLAWHMTRVQCYGMQALAASYRSLPIVAAARLLSTGSAALTAELAQSVLVPVLEETAKSGNKHVQHALEQLLAQQNGSTPATQLVFKA